MTLKKNQKLRSSNRTNSERCGRHVKGAALLPGVLLCGKCGRRMTVRYTGTGGIRPYMNVSDAGNMVTKQPVPLSPPMFLTRQCPKRFSPSAKPSELEISLKVMHGIGDTK